MSMNLVKNIESLNKLIQKYFVKNTITNNYVLASAYSEFITNKKLFLVTSGSNACILVENEEFYKLYFFINNQNDKITLEQNKPIVMEILYRGEAQRPDEMIIYWEKCGFKRHLTRDNMMASYKQLMLSSENNIDVEIRYAETEVELIFTKNLIENSLDKYTGDILTYNEVQMYVRNKNIICAYWQGKLCGFLQFEIKNNVVWLGHIAVDPEFRGKGIAKELVKAYIVNNVSQPNTRYQLWVLQDNVSATTLYHKFGFIYGNKSSASMLKN